MTQVCTGFHHIAIRVADFEAAYTFYVDGMGFTPAAQWTSGDGAPIALLDTGNGNYLELFGAGTLEAQPEGPFMHFAMRVDNVEAAVERAVAAGATVTVEPKALTIPSTPQPLPVRLAFVLAPGGIQLEFFENRLT